MSLHRSQESILAASQLPADLRAQSLIIPYFTADIESASLITSAPRGKGSGVALFRIASTGAFRILTNLPSSSAVADSMDINFKTASSGAKPGAAATKEFKEVKIYGYDRSFVEMQLIGSGSQQANGTLTDNAAANSIGLDSTILPKLMLEFILSRKVNQNIEYLPFQEYHADRIVVIRNKFDIIPRSQFKISKGSTE